MFPDGQHEGSKEGSSNLAAPLQALPSVRGGCGRSGCLDGADLLSVRALRLKWRTIWCSGSGCFSVSASSSSSALGDFYTDQCRQVLGVDFSMCHTTACEQREGKAQGTECVRLQAQRETTMSRIYFRTEALRVQGLAYKWICFFQSKKHSNFGLKQDERKSQSLTVAKALHTPISKTHASSGHPSSGGQPWTVTERLGLFT